MLSSMVLPAEYFLLRKISLHEYVIYRKYSILLWYLYFVFVVGIHIFHLLLVLEFGIRIWNLIYYLNLVYDFDLST